MEIRRWRSGGEEVERTGREGEVRRGESREDVERERSGERERTEWRGEGREDDRERR